MRPWSNTAAPLTPNGLTDPRVVDAVFVQPKADSRLGGDVR